MQFDIDNTTVLFIAGVVILTTSLLLHLRKRSKIEAEKKAQRRAAALAAKEAERKRQLQTGAPIKIKPGSLASKAVDRIPLTEPYDHTFSGTAAPRQIAKWETEIHQIGRQMIGQLDSKMVALQTLTLEANRTANRLELLVEHLERLAAVSGSVPTLASKAQMSPQSEEESELRPPGAVESSEAGAEKPVQAVPDSPNILSNENVGSPLDAFADVLQDLESELDRFHEEIADASTSQAEPSLPATVLKPESVRDKELEDETPARKTDGRRLPPTIALSSGSPLEETTETERSHAVSTPTREFLEPLSLSSPGLPGGSEFSDLPSNVRMAASPTVFAAGSGSKRITVTASPPHRSSGGLSLDSLYGQERENRKEEAVFSMTGARTFDRKRKGGPETPPVAFPQQFLKEGSRLALRKQVEMLADYGYTANQIAQNLNITVGEVDLMLSLRG